MLNQSSVNLYFITVQYLCIDKQKLKTCRYINLLSTGAFSNIHFAYNNQLIFERVVYFGIIVLMCC
jgi:hypothetical protein